jgi:hypothetical protein
VWLLLAVLCAAEPAKSAKLSIPPEAQSILDKIYSADWDAAIQDAKQFESAHPDDPLGYLLEAEAMWWKIWCNSADYKYGMTNARHRAKLAADQPYLKLAAKVKSVALAQAEQHEATGMHFYAGMGDALAARLYGLRG